MSCNIKFSSQNITEEMGWFCCRVTNVINKKNFFVWTGLHVSFHWQRLLNYVVPYRRRVTVACVAVRRYLNIKSKSTSCGRLCQSVARRLCIASNSGEERVLALISSNKNNTQAGATIRLYTKWTIIPSPRSYPVIWRFFYQITVIHITPQNTLPCNLAVIPQGYSNQQKHSRQASHIIWQLFRKITMPAHRRWHHERLWSCDNFAWLQCLRIADDGISPVIWGLVYEIALGRRVRPRWFGCNLEFNLRDYSIEPAKYGATLTCGRVLTLPLL